MINEPKINAPISFSLDLLVILPLPCNSLVKTDNCDIYTLLISANVVFITLTQVYATLNKKAIPLEVFPALKNPLRRTRGHKVK